MPGPLEYTRHPPRTPTLPSRRPSKSRAKLSRSGKSASLDEK
ncbi:Uncharacterised protein [Mycobacteroides abscessus]|nr:Uncharacterised protein [Mycobacteroides abscessus]